MMYNLGNTQLRQSTKMLLLSNPVESRYNAVQYTTILHTDQQM